MSNVNDNDIDDLFKRASEKYPLRTDSADWDRLASALEKEPSLILSPAGEEGNKRKRRRFFWLFLLLPLGGVGYYAWQSGSTPVSASSSPSRTVSSGAPRASEDIQGQSAGTEKSAGEEKLSGGQKSSEKQAPARVQASDADAGTTTAPTAGANHKTAADPETAADPKPGIVRRFMAGSKLIRAPKSTTGTIAGEKNKLAGGRSAGPAKKKGPATVGSTGQVTTGLTGSTTAGSGRPAKENSATHTRITGGEREAAASRLTVRRASVAGGYSLDVVVKAPAPEKAADKKDKKPGQTKPSRFYAGLLVSPDLSTVKFQSIKGLGTTAGILLGYNINAKWAIESGLYLDHKKYYTDGEYFDKSKIQLNPNYKLLTVNGGCNMLEIPVNIRYNLSAGPKMKWFATAGFSTYLMSGDHYSDKVQNISNGNMYNSYWDYNNHYKYFFSIFNLSVGYEQRLGKIGNLRLEPFLRVPLSGIGTGSLHVMSAGLNIGITRKLW